jgi:hypothetical protein
MLTLQINTSGAWRHLLTFAPARRAEILAAAAALAGTLGDRTKWSILHPEGRREWLRDFGKAGAWQAVTADQPAPLVDVMVSVFVDGDVEPETLMAYRKQGGSETFYLSGTADQVIRGVYAFAEVIAPAPRVAA